MHWIIRSGENDRWSVRLGGCDREHAESVLSQLQNDLSVPNELMLNEEGADPPKPPSLLRRIFGG